ncbi:hypothetical protein [Arhodomonas sp. AD133]|uniref:hypothetical protein n=1 Tax=Arhodomonas sp. AD133 TaxID=3415009 RepID=UPI003EBF441A
MKLLIVGAEPADNPLVEGLMASPLWDVHTCADIAEAERLAAGERFDYILVDSGDQARLEAAATGCQGAPSTGAQIIQLRDAVGTELQSADGNALYGCYAVEPRRFAAGGGSWVFEYHAPCEAAESA